MDITSIALSGLNSSQASFERAAARLSTGAGDLATDTVNLLQAKNDFAANISVVKAADEIAKHTIDLLA